LEKARRGEFMPWAYNCYGYRYLPKRQGCPPHVLIEPVEAEVVRQRYRALVEEHLTCRQITKRLNAAQIPTPTGHNTVWQAATVSAILTHRVYAGQARYNYRQPGLPRYRKHAAAPPRTLKTGRHYRPERDWIWSDASPLISPELFEKAQLQRNAAAARKLYQPSSHRYLLRTLVKWGDCGLAMNCSRHTSVSKRTEYLYYAAIPAQNFITP
jgi:hypothetical protein